MSQNLFGLSLLVGVSGALNYSKQYKKGREREVAWKVSLLLVGRRLLADGRVVVLGHGVLGDGRVAASDHAGVALEELARLVCGKCQQEFSYVQIHSIAIHLP